MQDLEDRLKELGDRVSRHAPSELRPTARALRRIRVGRAVRSGAVLATVAALVIAGFTGARSLTSDEALPPAERESNVSPFVDTWTTMDADGNIQTMTIHAIGEDTYEIIVHDDHAGLTYYRPNQKGRYVPIVKDVCSGSPATMTGTGDLSSATTLVVPSLVVTCDDGTKPQGVRDLPSLLEEQLGTLTFEHDPEADILMDSSSGLVWGRAEAENRIGDVSGRIMYGDKRGIWARDLTSPGDPSDRVRLSSRPWTPIEWSRDGSKLLLGRDDGGLFVVTPYASEPGADLPRTRLTDGNGSINGSSLSPDGTAVVYAVVREDYSSAIYVVDAEGGSPQILKQSDDGDDLSEGLVQEPKWSPDGSQIAYFGGAGDHSNVLRVMDSDGTDSRVVVENSEMLRAGHVRGLQWSPDGSELAFSIESRLYVVGVDGSGFRLVSDDGVDPYWSPDGSYIAYTRPDPETEQGGSLEIMRLDDLKVQNFGAGESGPWTAQGRLAWPTNGP